MPSKNSMVLESSVSCTMAFFQSLVRPGRPAPMRLALPGTSAGRNSYGRITVRHRGGGNKRKYRIIDFKRDKEDMSATVLRLEYDPNRSANIALLEYEDGEPGVHDRAADRGTPAHVALASGLAQLDVLVINVAHLADGGLAVEADDAHLAGGHTDLGVRALLGGYVRHRAPPGV